MTSVRYWLSLARTFAERRPSTLTLFVTNRCNARCRMCFNWRAMDDRDSRRELDLEEIGRIAASLGHLHSLIVSGGEPLLRDDLPQIVALFHRLAGTRHVSIPTNMLLPDAAERVRDLAATHPGVFFRVLMGLDGVGAAHDEIRQHPGAFATLMANYRRLTGYRPRLPNLSLNVATVLSACNAAEIEGLLAFAGGLEIDDLKLIFVRGEPRESWVKEVGADAYRRALAGAEAVTAGGRRTRSFYNDLFSAASLVSKELIAESLDSRCLAAPCTAGARFIVIDEIGRLFPCETRPDALGDVRRDGYDVPALLASPRAREVQSEIREGRCWCTMDCNTISSVIYRPRLFPRVARKLMAIRRARRAAR